MTVATAKQVYKCRICDNSDHNVSYRVKEMMLGLRDMHDYFECANCGCLQITSIPENIQDYYPDKNYYSYNAIKKVTGIKGLLTKLRDRYASTGESLIGKIMQQVQPHDKLPSVRHTGVTLDSKVLDVGCGAGHLLHSMKEAGFKKLLGIDPFNSKEISYKNGLSIKPQSIHDLSISNKPEDGWDMIMFNHSYEHVFDQYEVLEKTFNLLKPNGICMIRIPTVTSWAWDKYGIDWVQLDAPRHLFLHSLKSMHVLANNTGFNLYDVVYDSFAFQQWGSEQYRKDIALHDKNSYATNPDTSLFSDADIQNFEKHSKKLNAAKAGDQAAFYLRKQS